MKTKNMKRTAWKRLLEKEYIVRDCAPWGYPGRESVLKIHKVIAPLWVKEGYGEICIADAGHTWVQVACEGQPYWLTAMFDRDDRFLQIYFDIARPPCFDDADDPTIEDLYLDVVLTSGLELVVMDGEELDEALETGEIDRKTYDYAQNACQTLLRWLEIHKQDMVEYVTKVYRELK
jgi:predicted RNA-binding protein associated with RNAse of E/G family